MRSLQLMIASLTLFCCSSSRGDQPTQPQKLGDWQKDPVCQAVFFGVLDGLYRDDVSLETVDNIIGSHDSKQTLQQRLQRSFVTKCPLCEPTFHAFLAYQGHKVQCATFNLGNAKDPLDNSLTKSLQSDDTQTRLQAMARLISKWVAKKFESSDLSLAQIADWEKRVNTRFNQGKSELMGLLSDRDPKNPYRGWSPYWGCAACNGVRTASPALHDVTNDVRKLEP